MEKRGNIQTGNMGWSWAYLNEKKKLELLVYMTVQVVCSRFKRGPKGPPVWDRLVNIRKEL